MTVEAMIEAGVQAFKQNVEAFCANSAGEALSPSAAQAVARGLQQAVPAPGAAAYRAYVESKEEVPDIVARPGGSVPVQV
jgi:hypothetical protein